jgi:hypothetical protein
VLYTPHRHEPRNERPWDEEAARDAIRAITAEAEESFQPRRFWPAHPLDRPGPPEKSLYLGAAGVAWALHSLERAGVVSLRMDLSSTLRAAHEAYLAEPDSGEVVPSLFLGETGILLAAWVASPLPALADRLRHLVASNSAHPANELFWGAPGTLLAALHLHEATGEERWRALISSTLAEIWSRWTFRSERRCHLWTQHLYGDVLEYLGGAHGFAGNAHALLRAAPIHSDREELYRRCAAAALATASIEGDVANWPPVLDFRPGREREWLVQWCHGAPGVVIALASIPAGFDERLDALLLRGGELIWQAGPLRKGSGLCHGTAGNGYAFLKLYRRTAAKLWLERARAFAMHALGQWEQANAHYGRGRYTLWTGDVGLALYLADCIHADCAVPVLDARA